MRAATRITTLALLAVLALTGCEDASRGGGGGGGADDGAAERTDASALAATFRGIAADVVAAQEEAGVAPTPLGRLLEDCVAVDEAALDAIAAALGIEGQTGEVLNATLQSPDGPAPTLSCAVRFGDASAGAVVLSVGPTDGSSEELVAALVAADYTEIPDATAEGLPDEEVLLLEATGFAASRAVWAAEGFQIGLTANADLDSGALLDALPVAVAEVQRVLG